MHRSCSVFFFFSATPTTEIYTLSLHDALPISWHFAGRGDVTTRGRWEDAELTDQFVSRVERFVAERSEEHTSELQSLRHLVCRLLLEKKKKNTEERDAQRN